jgi:tellurite resistance protein TehA-like permease
MGIGIGVVFIAVGLILALAVGDAVDGVNLVLVGWILAGVGALALVVGLIMSAQRSRHTVEKSVHKDVTTD